ncbi:hypothetical protein RUM44_005355 [Polyplax serrata]|uniref:Uncharacterized protein n=1 Tax=Polyplax serrata TaxID=468196 RepID=A0ABR1ADB2_POLSC
MDRRHQKELDVPAPSPPPRGFWANPIHMKRTGEISGLQNEGETSRIGLIMKIIKILEDQGPSKMEKKICYAKTSDTNNIEKWD